MGNFASMTLSKKTNAAAVIIAAVLLASCSVFRNKTQQGPAPVAEASRQQPEDKAAPYRASATKYWELAHTAIDIRFNLAERTADGIATLTMHPYWYSIDSVVLDAKSMQVKQVLDRNGRALPFTADSLKLIVRLPQHYQSTDTLLLKISYKALPYESKAGGSSAIREDRGLYFINADRKEPYMPVQIWTQGETEANSHWFPTFDNPIFKSTFSITLHVPDSFRTLSNGSLARSVREEGHFRADTWNQEQPIAAYLVMMAVGDFAIHKEAWRGKEVSYYVPQDYAAYAADIFRHTSEMMEFFSRKLGVDYPWNKYSQVVGYQYVSGAMENVSASLFGAFNLKDRRQLADDNNDYIVAHELFHQWFGDYVTAESWSHLTLNESFADYSEHLWTEYKYGEDARANYWLYGLTRYLGQAKTNDPPLLRFYYRSQEDMFDRISYSKGGLILHYLRSLTGDEAFFKALHLYLTQNAFGNTEVPQLRMAFEKVTGRDWNWFFNEWYYRGGHPRLLTKYIYDDAAGKARMIVTQVQPDSVGIYELPVRNRVIVNGVLKDIDWTLSGRQDTFTVDYSGGQRPVIVPDAAHWVPGVWEDIKTPGQWYIQYHDGSDFLTRRAALLGLATRKTSDTCRMVYTEALSDKSPLIRAVAIDLYDYESDNKVPEEWRKKLGKIAFNDPDNKVKAKALNALASLKEAAFIDAYQAAISDSSYKVAAAGLLALNNVNHRTAERYARELKLPASKGNALLYQGAKVIAQEGMTEDLDFFMDKTLHLFENERKMFLTAFQTYLVNAREKEAFTKGMTFMTSLALQHPDDLDGFYYGVVLLNVQKYARAQAKAASGREDIDKWKERAEAAQRAWGSYKEKVTDEDILDSISELEKED